MEQKTMRLPEWHALYAYVRSLHTTLKTWISFAENGAPLAWIDRVDVLGWLHEIDHTFTVLELEYAFDTLRTLEIQSVASGFPLRHQLRMLTNLAGNSVRSSREHKRELLAHVYKYGRVNPWLLEMLAKARARERIAEKQTLPLYALRRLVQVETQNGAKVYRGVWHSYGYRHQPALYVMLFERPGDDVLGVSDVEELSLVLREETTQLPKLGTLAKRIDGALATVQPKVLARFTLGPVFIPGVTLDENPLQDALNKSPRSDVATVSRAVYEYVLADGAEPVERLVDTKGRPHAVVQTYAVRTFDDECNDREVTALEKWLFAPHCVVQAVDQEYLRETGHILFVDGGT